MQISTSWLAEWVDFGNDVPALGHALTMAGLEIEGITPAAPAISGVVVAEVRHVQRHPDAEKLNVCRVFDGEQEWQIVCGAANVRAGLKAPLARIGAELPGGLKIKAAKLRGIESSGMLCSAKELGLGEDVPGLLELPDSAVPGQDIVRALMLDDRILAVNLTPNRGDCMSMLGVAREVATVRNTQLCMSAPAKVESALQDIFPVRLNAGTACPKFLSRVIRGIRPGARSPLWLRERLRRAGLRPISAVVDVTNYVMLELGQPMHAYDVRNLDGAIIVRHATPAEKLTLLDGREIELQADVLVIADMAGPLGLAGVMGGAASGISDETAEVLLEVAYFSPSAIAGRGRRYGLVTDASQRFERGVDPHLQERAIERATELLLEIAGGYAGPVSAIKLDGWQEPEHREIHLRHARVNRVLGMSVDETELVGSLERLGMRVSEAGKGEWRVRPPSWRFDIAIEEDLIEEVVRIHGYDKVAGRDALVSQVITPATETRIAAERLADLLAARGYQEAVTYSFVDPALQQVLFPQAAALVIKNPISAELAVMRLSLWPGLVQALRENQRRQQPRVRLFELGRGFSAEHGTETELVAGLAAGSRLPEQWGEPTTAIDFYDVKADVEALLRLTGDADSFRFEAGAHPALHPGQTARIVRSGRPVGWLGTLHPERVRALGLTYAAIVFELEVESALAAIVPEAVEISKFPGIRRDLAVIVSEEITFDAITSAARRSAGSLLKDVTAFDVYRGQGIDKGKKSMALALNLQDTSRTLTDSEADAIVTRVVEHLGSELGAKIRDK
ncbi:MAG: phenylalanine--tRNA ligase subunit beta [Steroidobacteraceae bacterium]